MTLYAFLLYAVTSSTAVSDSERMALTIQRTYANTPTLNLVQLPKEEAPECVEFCGKDPETNR